MAVRGNCTSHLARAVEEAYLAVSELQKKLGSASPPPDFIQAVHELDIATCRLSTASFLVALSESNKPVGDFHLVSKREQDRGRRNAGRTQEPELPGGASAGAVEEELHMDNIIDSTLNSPQDEDLVSTGIRLCQACRKVQRTIWALAAPHERLSTVDTIDICLNSDNGAQEDEEEGEVNLDDVLEAPEDRRRAKRKSSLNNGKEHRKVSSTKKQN